MTKELWNKLVISKIVSKVGQNWKGTEKINLTEFYAGTRPKFVMAHCMLEHIDCRRLWTVRSESDIKVGYVFPMAVSILPHAAFGPNDNKIQL